MWHVELLRMLHSPAIASVELDFLVLPEEADCPMPACFKRMLQPQLLELIRPHAIVVWERPIVACGHDQRHELSWPSGCSHCNRAQLQSVTYKNHIHVPLGKLCCQRQSSRASSNNTGLCMCGSTKGRQCRHEGRLLIICFLCLQSSWIKPFWKHAGGDYPQLMSRVWP